jgi:hypothetical protein
MALWRAHSAGAGGCFMTVIFLLFVPSALSGFVIGKSFSWRALAVARAALALLTAIMLQGQGFTPLAGISTIVACLIVNQLAYLLAILILTSNAKLPATRSHTAAHTVLAAFWRRLHRTA